MFAPFRHLLSFVSALTVAATSVCAQAAPALIEKASAQPAGPKTVTVDIVASRTAGVPQAAYHLAVRLQHEPGWHTYWRFPGDTGFSTDVDWKLPNKNWKISPLGWPLPERETKGNITSFQYSGTVLLPYKLDIPWGTPWGTSGRVSAKVSWLACKDVCIPGEKTVSFTVPIKVASEPSEHALLFEKAKKLTPEVIVTEHIRATRQGNDVRLDLMPLAGHIDKKIEFIPVLEDDIDLRQASRQEKKDDVTQLYLKLTKEFVESHKTQLNGILVADGGPEKGGWAIETSIPVQEGIVITPKPATAKVKEVAPELPKIDAKIIPQELSVTSLSALIFAFLGGLILNLMPCVFPVLSLKILQLVDSGRRRGALPLHGLTFTLGILLSMGVLSGLLLALRTMGLAVGWGFQLQTPWVVASLAILFFTLALNLWGIFEFTAATHLADSRAARSLPATGPLGSFFTGVLAVIVASPCTAPFMGAALGYAITQPPIEAIAVFLAVGLGMALPWLILTLIPVWTRFLPRPGAWMLTFKHIMALPMLAATLWLLWVLSRQVNIYGIVTTLFGMTAFSAFLWTVGREQYGRGSSKVLKYTTLAATVICLVLVGIDKFNEETKDNNEQWRPWSMQAVNDSISSGHPVFIDFTAAWCVTCQFNKATALRTQESTQNMDSLGYHRYVADWTNRDAAITKMLNAFGRTGVPLYLLYNTQGDPTVLPELLKEEDFIAALKKNAASGPALGKTQKSAP